MTIDVSTFRLGTDKEAARKPCEEAMEAYGAWERMEYAADSLTMALACADLADELADTIQACCNLAARHGIDMGEAMRRCEERNRERGRY